MSFDFERAQKDPDVKVQWTIEKAALTSSFNNKVTDLKDLIDSTKQYNGIKNRNPSKPWPNNV